MFNKAERKKTKLKLLLSGPSGSGKTYSALLIASAMAKKIAVIDTENGSASVYAGMKGIPEFDVVELGADFTVAKYIDAIFEAKKLGYDLLIIDSITPEWDGKGGLLEKKELIDKASKGNNFANWATVSKEHKLFLDAILQTDIHIICTVRSKQDHQIVEMDGRKKVEKMGMAPIQRPGIEYDFFVAFEFSMAHVATTSKDRTGLFDGKSFIPSAKTGEELINFLNSGKEVKAPEVDNSKISDVLDSLATVKTGEELKAKWALLNALEQEFAREDFNKARLKIKANSVKANVEKEFDSVVERNIAELKQDMNVED